MYNTKSRPVFNGIRDPWYCAKMLEAFNPVWIFPILLGYSLYRCGRVSSIRVMGFSEKSGDHVQSLFWAEGQSVQC
jgi:hypothetical protein